MLTAHVVSRGTSDAAGRPWGSKAQHLAIGQPADCIVTRCFVPCRMRVALPKASACQLGCIARGVWHGACLRHSSLVRHRRCRATAGPTNTPPRRSPASATWARHHRSLHSRSHCHCRRRCNLAAALGAPQHLQHTQATHPAIVQAYSSEFTMSFGDMCVTGQRAVKMHAWYNQLAEVLHGAVPQGYATRPPTGSTAPNCGL